MYSLVIVAAGTGTRSKLVYNKIFYKTQKNNKTILEITVNNFLNFSKIDNIIIVYNQNDKKIIEKIIEKIDSKKINLVLGGETRQESVYKGIIKAKNNYVFVHDAARPYVNNGILKRLDNEIEQNQKISCFVLGVPLKDTINQYTNGFLSNILDRDELVAMQTPQVVNKEQYLKIYSVNENFSDESSLFFKNKEKVKIVLGDEKNKKITTPTDLEEFYLYEEENDEDN